jgi:hypothetical protein
MTKTKQQPFPKTFIIPFVPIFHPQHPCELCNITVNCDYAINPIGVNGQFVHSQLVCQCLEKKKMALLSWEEDPFIIHVCWKCFAGVTFGNYQEDEEMDELCISN